MSRRFAQWLAADKLPIAISLFLAAFAWAVSLTLGRYDKVPVLEYTVFDYENGKRANPKASWTITPPPNQPTTVPLFYLSLRNMSPTIAIECAKISTGRPAPSERKPVSFVEINKTGIVAWSANPAAPSELILSLMQPGAGLQVTGWGERSFRTSFTLGRCDSKDTSAAGPLPILKERSLETRLLRYSTAILWGTLVLWGVLLALLYMWRATLRDS